MILTFSFLPCLACFVVVVLVVVVVAVVSVLRNLERKDLINTCVTLGNKAKTKSVRKFIANNCKGVHLGAFTFNN